MESLLVLLRGVEEGNREARLVAISPTIEEKKPQSNQTKTQEVTLIDSDRGRKVIATRGAHHCHPYSDASKDSLSSQHLHQVQRGRLRRHG